MINNIQISRPFATPDAGSRQKLFANNLASAYAAGAPQEMLKNYDRPGLSRGKAQMNQAGIDSARTVADGVRDAYLQDDALRNAAAYGVMQQNAQKEQYAQQLSALQQQDAYSRQMAALNRRQQSMNIVQGLLGGLLR